jgi:uncharacterized protein YndB with AHSA1/START domain
VEVRDNGFLARSDVVVNANPEKVWSAMIRVGRWWNPEHTYSGDAGRMTIDPRPGGCFCERLEKRGGVQHAEVVYAAPGKALRLVGAFGPLQQDGVAGSLTWNLAADGAGTKVTQTYSVGGYRQGGFVEMAPLVDQVMSNQVLRLQRFIETGSP